MAGSQFTEEQIRRSLLTLAKHAGNSIAASEDLKHQGLELNDRTLRLWREKRRDLYQELHETHAREIEGQLVTEFRDLAQAAASAARLAVDKTVTALNANEIKDPAGAGRNLATTAAISMDKLYMATDRPTVITEHRDASEILKGIEGRYVNGTAEEDTQPAALIPERATTNAREQSINPA